MKRLVALLLLGMVLAGCTTSDEANDKSTPPVTSDEPTDDDETIAETFDQPMLGSDDAPITVLAWEAPGCSACRSFHLGDYQGSFSDIEERLIATGEVAWYGMAWTIGYSYDQVAGVALECTFLHGSHDAYWSLMDFVYEEQGTDAETLRDAVNRTVRQAGGNHDAATQCMDEQQTISQVQADIQEGQSRNVRTSPGFVILHDGEEIVVGARDLAPELEALIA